MSLRRFAQRFLERLAEPLAPPSAPSGSSTHRLRVGGRERYYELFVPPTLDQSRPSPLIMGFHGRNSKPGQFAYISQLSQRAGRLGYVIAYPAAEGGVWNPAAGEENYDIAFIRAMLDDIHKLILIDPNRVYAVGMSNGGQMVYRLACELSDRLAAVAVCACGMTREDCVIRRPVPVIHFHGTQDPLVPLAWGEYAVSRWIANNECELEPKETFRNGAAKCLTYSNPATGGSVTFCTVEGMGHQWPGLAIKLSEKEAQLLAVPLMLAHLGPGTDDLDATGMLLSFFEGHPAIQVSREQSGS
jgi:polyhydroxybutyrate depolymerase